MAGGQTDAQPEVGGHGDGGHGVGHGDADGGFVMDSTGQNDTWPVFAAFGNPLLDIIVEDVGGDLVRMFHLERNVAQEVDTKVSGLSDEILKKWEKANNKFSLILIFSRSSISYVGGGCALNSVRVFQWLSGEEKRAVFLGGLGMDDNGEVLENIVKESGALTSFAVTADLPTGHCIALVDKDERTLCANLGAAAKYETSDLWTKNNINILQHVKVIYVEGFFLNHSFEATMELATFAKNNEKIFIFNLCGEYVCKDKTYCEQVLQLLPFVNFIFGNQSEYLSFISTVETRLESHPDTIRRLHNIITANNEESKAEDDDDDDEKEVNINNLTAVVTDGNNPVKYCCLGSTWENISLDVPRLQKELIKVVMSAI